MKSVLTFQQIRERYAGEWLLIKDPQLDDGLAVVAGEVLAHSASRDEVYRQLARAQGQRVSLEYAGKIPSDLAVAL